MKRTIAEIGQLYDGPHATPTRRTEGPYFLNIASLQSGRLDLSTSDHVSEEDFTRWTRRVQPEAGDLLFSYETRLGEAALMPANVRACLGRRMALLRPNRELIDPRYLLYYYLGPEFQTLIERNTQHGATVNRISLSTMGSWVVDIPVLADQRAVADLLGALDDKIVANDRAIQLAADLAASRFDAIGASQRQSQPLGSILNLEYGRSLPAPRRVSGSVQVLGSGGLTGHHNETWLPPNGVVVGRKGTVGAVYWVTGSYYPIDTTFYVVPKPGIPLIYCYHALRTIDLASANSDSAVPGLNRTEAYAFTVRVPDEESMKRASEEAELLFRMKAAIETENVRLGEMRDTILPPLISGRLRIRDVKQHVGEAI